MRARRGEGCRNPEVSSNAVQISKTEEIIDRVDGDMGGVGERREQVAEGITKRFVFFGEGMVVVSDQDDVEVFFRGYGD